MLKRPPGRNQRNKRIRVKHILQVALLLGVCFWLIYQLKHSYDKKSALGENDPKTLIKTQTESELLKLGRKDLPQKDVTTQLIREEEEEEEALGEDDEKLHIEEETHEAEEREEEDPKNRLEEIEEEGQKHETEEQEENKDEDSVDVGKRAEDEEMDENDLEVKEREDDHNENLVDEEKEREDGGGENDSDRNEEEIENREENEKTLLDDQDNEGGDENSHEVREAREEHYKGDDASSAVTHDAQVVSIETEKVSSENSNETSETSVDEDGNRHNMRLVDHGRTSENGTLSVPAETDEKHQDNSSIPVENSLVDANGKPQAGDLREVENSSSIVSLDGLAEVTQATSSHHPNDTETVSESVPSQNTTVEGLFTREGGTEQSVVGKFVENVLNSTEIHASHQVENNMSENNLLSDGTAKVEDSSRSSTINEGMHDTEHEESKNEDGGKNEELNKEDSSKNEELKNEDASKNEESVNENASVNENSNGQDTSKTEELEESDESSKADVLSDSTNTTEDTVQDDPIDSSDSHISEAEKEARTDLDTLPEIQTEGDENGEAAAE